VTRYFLGIDIGGTKTHALIADESGRALGFGTAGPGNPKVVGHEGLALSVRAAVNQALLSADLSSDKLTGVGLGIAGYDWPSEREQLLCTIKMLGFKAPVELVNDSFIALLSGAEGGWGVVIVAGTHCNCRGWDRDRKEGRITGYGIRMGEAAGGGELITKAIQAVACEWSQRGPRTRLTQAFLKLTGAHDNHDLIEGLTTGRYNLSSSAAPIVFQVASAGDSIAGNLIKWAGRELADLATGVIRQLRLEEQDFELVLSGGLFDGGMQLAQTVAGRIQAIAPGARAVLPSVPPVVGGVVLAMEKAGLPYPDSRETLIGYTERFLGIS
jgi:N-acetylglucosamine kinase-like BadF-type ATPase